MLIAKVVIISINNNEQQTSKGHLYILYQCNSICNLALIMFFVFYLLNKIPFVHFPGLFAPSISYS